MDQMNEPLPGSFIGPAEYTSRWGSDKMALRGNNPPLSTGTCLLQIVLRINSVTSNGRYFRTALLVSF